MKISVLIIAKNAEEVIADCLDSVSGFDEIIVLNNNSQDRTGEIAERMGAKVFVDKSDDFSELRNFALKQAKNDWVFYIDSDERADSELVASLKEIVSKNIYAAIVVKRKNFYLGDHEWPKIEKMERAFNRNRFDKWVGKVHESPKYEGESTQALGFLNHYTHQNLTQMLEKTIEWSEIEARNRLEANHPKMALWRFPRVMISTFFDYYILQRGYKIGTAGFVESIYQSFSTMITYAKLWELQKEKS